MYSELLLTRLCPRAARVGPTLGAGRLRQDRPADPRSLPAVGGIYTVIKTKAPVTVREYGDRYLLVGVLAYKTAPMEVDAIDWRNPEAGAWGSIKN